jgi:RimJ/RimL family protein N-acetyltransferase
MEYFKTILLKDGRKCILRNGTAGDGEAALANFILTHEQTDFLLSYPDESTMTAERESQFLQKKTESENEIEILAEVDGIVAGLAGIEAVGGREKIRHRAEFGISVDRAFWNLGIGTALMNACTECARRAGYEQIELNAVAENETAIAMYRKAGYQEFGRNPRGFKSRLTGYQEVVYMRMELDQE